MNRKEIFLFVKQKALAQNKKSENKKDGSCLFRDEEGNYCHIGHLIKKEFFSEIWNNSDIEDIQVREALKNSGIELELFLDKSLLNEKEIRSPDIQFLRDIQKIHDHFPPSKWENQFNKFENLHFK